MTLKSLILATLLCALCHNAAARTSNRCEVARALVARGVSRDLVSSWVCIAQYASNYETEIVGLPNAENGSRNWGIFQLNDRYWCDPQDGRQSANICNMACPQVATNDIGDALHCAQKVWQVQGFSAWPVWASHCGSGSNLPSVDDCFVC